MNKILYALQKFGDFNLAIIIGIIYIVVICPYYILHVIFGKSHKTDLWEKVEPYDYSLSNKPF